jgi:filamentous hemagglutinin
VTVPTPKATLDELATNPMEVRKIINSKYAGQDFPLEEVCQKLAKKYPNKAQYYLEVSKKYPAGVKFSIDGFPDFSPYAIKTAKVKGLTGDRTHDAKLANEAVGLKSTPEQYTWHHHQDLETMQLVPRDLHEIVRHTGGASKIGNSDAW